MTDNDTITNAEVEEILTSRSDDWWAKYSELEPTGMRMVVEHLASALLEERSESVILLDTLKQLCNHVNVGTNTNLMHLELGGVPAFRPIEQPMKDRLGTLFTLLLNARTLCEVHAERIQKWERE